MGGRRGTLLDSLQDPMFSVFDELMNMKIEEAPQVEEEAPMRRTAIMKKGPPKEDIPVVKQEPITIQMPAFEPVATNVVVRQEFMYNVLSSVTPIEV